MVFLALLCILGGPPHSPPSLARGSSAWAQFLCLEPFFLRKIYPEPRGLRLARPAKGLSSTPVMDTPAVSGCKGCTGFNSRSRKLRGDRLNLLLLLKCLNRVKQEKAKIILIAPVWPSQIRFPDLIHLSLQPPLHQPPTPDQQTQESGKLKHPNLSYVSRPGSWMVLGPRDGLVIQSTQHTTEY